MNFHDRLKFIIDDIELAIRAEIFSIDRLKVHAENIAQTHILSTNPRKGYNLAKRLKENKEILFQNYQTITEIVNQKQFLTSAAEWLNDNFHIVEEQLNDVQLHLPIWFYQELPKLATGPLVGYPRVYELALEFVSHTDSHFDPELLIAYVRAYQNVHPLTIGELWAIPITLRVVLIENLRRLSIRIVNAAQARKTADEIADDIGLNVHAQAIKNFLHSLETQKISKAFLVQLLQRLRYQDPTNQTSKWLNEKLQEMNLTPDELVLLEHNQQSAGNLTVRNIITSMRLISAYDWRAFFESVSLVNEILQVNPTFKAIDFPTQDQYLHAIEELSKGSKYSEIDLAKFLITKIESYRSQPQVRERNLDPGYFLIANGRKEFEQEINFKPTLYKYLLDLYIDNALISYIGVILFISFAILIFSLIVNLDRGIAWWWCAFFFVAAFFPASDIAIAISNKLATVFIGPHHLPSIKLSEGVPVELATCVVMPMMLLNEQVISEHVEQLEVYYLSNPEGQVQFALLSDWKDSNEELTPEDTRLLNFAIERITMLQNKYGKLPDGQKRFFIFHRKRQWNPSENKWMGWERKRGKLHEFNLLLRGSTETSYISEKNNEILIVPQQIKYVITLDADTRMPMSLVKKLVGTISHPLNKAYLDPVSKKVREGYGILQPRVMAALPSRNNSSIFQRLFSGPCGVDPYTFTSSDIYQDLFKEGTYTGKGIYDVDIFEAALAGRIPENRVLSHDLLEGSYARCGFISDLDLFEDFPSHTEIAESRLNRWIRGDWQLLPWIFGDKSKTVSFINRWKMFDNLRRSLTAPALIFILALAWLLPSTPHYFWAFFVIFAVAFPVFIPFIYGLLTYPFNKKYQRTRIDLNYEFSLDLGQTICLLALLLNRATAMISTILCTLYRLLITKKKFLQWVSVAETKLSLSLSLNYFFRRHKYSVIFALLFGISILVFQTDTTVKIMAAPFIFTWILSPAIAMFISLPPKTNPVEFLNFDGVQKLRLIARRTWRFFTTFINEENNYLPPDNFQEIPNPVIAQRSSPTNFGLYLMSIISAQDFGWIGLHEMLDKLNLTLTVLQDLPRYKGHFFNWYDLGTKQSLEPKYVSSVDSGNLAAFLLVVMQTCKEYLESSLSDNKVSGIQDAMLILHESLHDIKNRNRRLTTVNLEQLQSTIANIEDLLSDIPKLPVDYVERWQAINSSAITMLDIAKTLVQEYGKNSDTEILFWANQVYENVESHMIDLRKLFSWVQYYNQAILEDPHSLLTQQVALLNKESILKFSLTNLYNYYGTIIHNLKNHSDKSIAINKLVIALEDSHLACKELMQRLIKIQSVANLLVDEMDFAFLFDATRKLFYIGFNVNDNSFDHSYYDMLASEARITSFIAIAKGDIPVKHWFSLSRNLTPLYGEAALISWSGSMFEYLMPSLIMYTPRGSLLDRTCRLIIRKQIDYGNEQQIPWGISESAYNIRDLHFNYQYTSFGVPGLGLQKGIGKDLVVAPYTTALAAMYYPKLALENFKRLEHMKILGTYGFYESIDFTLTRLPENKNFAIVKTYMAHHQGMSLVSLANVAFNGIMRHRFHNIPEIKAAELLLQEHIPHTVAMSEPKKNREETEIKDLVQPALRRFSLPNLSIPSTHFLSNGHYTVMLSSAGSGFSRWNNIALTRWREDLTCDNWGTYIFLHDVESKESWSIGYQPSAVKPDYYEVTFTEDKARIVREDGDITSSLDLVVSAEDNAEIRYITLRNTGLKTREIEITSYSEIVLAQQNADVMHPAFSNLFIQTEYNAETGSLIANRRPRSAQENPIWLAHVIAVDGSNKGIEYETDRAKFLGRGHTIRNAISIIEAQPLSNTVGAVLDPVMSLRTSINIPPGTIRHICFSTIVSNSREEILRLADKYHDPAVFERALSLSWTYTQAQLHYLGIDDSEANLFQQLANNLVYANPSMRTSMQVQKRNTLNACGLWAHNISGDNPIVLAHIHSVEDLSLVKQLLRMLEYWRLKKFAIDLVIINEKNYSYIQDLQVQLENLARTLRSDIDSANNYGNVYVLRGDLINNIDRDLLEASARVIIHSKAGSLSEQISRSKYLETKLVYEPKKSTPTSVPIRTIKSMNTFEIEFFNGLGGFVNDGQEYFINLGKFQYTPMPWINVIANSKLGFLISESGSSYTWSMNARENQITPWSNDPIIDPSGEVFYILDEDTKELWTPTALPIRLDNSNYTVRHGQGYSIFEHFSHGMEVTLTQYVSYDDPIKISNIHLKNKSGRFKTLSLIAYVEWILGASRAVEASHIITELDKDTNAIFAYNPWNKDFGKRIAFADLSGKQSSWTADRTEFIGRNGSLQKPYSVINNEVFSGNFGVGLDPCAVQKTSFILAPGEEIDLAFFLGQGDDRESAQQLILKYRGLDLQEVLNDVKSKWNETLNKIQIKTPDRATDILLNRWLLYQTLVCRYWARTAFYQAGGAYGFRDQLQDTMALVYSHPEITRAHIINAANHQFLEGDVQHWWHPPSDKGVRTKCSDDSIWLPYVVHFYIKATGDYSILDEAANFLEGKLLKPEEESSYFEPVHSTQSASIFEHCKRVLDRALATGVHGLPLIGSCDWNDGMNMVGHKGLGESVWLAWFLYATLVDFAEISKVKGYDPTVWLDHANNLKLAIEREAWDGAWYKRAFYDDGTPLGSSMNAECRVDSLAQSWSVISQAAPADKALKAMESVEKYLIKPGDDLILLFTPPFDKTSHDPGYIKGYLPGIRENGSQYTHAAIWSVIAFAMLGNANKAYEFFVMLNPITHASNRAGVHKYKVEPYVIAADIYSEHSHLGRGGWTWYTGSASWMYRAGIESILGLKINENRLRIDPCIPDHWQNFTVNYQHHSTHYEIQIENHAVDKNKIELDGKIIINNYIPLIDDGKHHKVKVSLTH